ncbi:hypothetical protein E2C01_051041 [Portunus trituberculatus]|uniref:MADF domain-containing protein n=1 Tax=Portunus trituberculatus TaxID=210409 RepID=A0A5B7GHN9_PORTR|nr:hypothetical protein [Portunus trituberculatus]
MLRASTKNCAFIMPLQWTNGAELLLIEKVRSNPALWDVKHKDNSKKLLKREMYKVLAQGLQEELPEMEGIDADAVMKKVNILKTSFRRELAKKRELKSGPGGNYVPKWKFFESLTFLADTDTLQSSASNLEKSVPCSPEKTTAPLKKMIGASGTAAPDQDEDMVGSISSVSATCSPSPTASGSPLITLRPKTQKQAKTEEAMLESIQQCEKQQMVQQLKPTGDREREAFVEWIRTVILDLDHNLWRRFQHQISDLTYQFIAENDKMKSPDPTPAM